MLSLLYCRGSLLRIDDGILLIVHVAGIKVRNSVYFDHMGLLQLIHKLNQNKKHAPFKLSVALNKRRGVVEKLRCTGVYMCMCVYQYVCITFVFPFCFGVFSHCNIQRNHLGILIEGMGYNCKMLGGTQNVNRGCVYINYVSGHTLLSHEPSYNIYIYIWHNVDGRLYIWKSIDGRLSRIKGHLIYMYIYRLMFREVYGSDC